MVVWDPPQNKAGTAKGWEQGRAQRQRLCSTSWREPAVLWGAVGLTACFHLFFVRQSQRLRLSAAARDLGWGWGEKALSMGFFSLKDQVDSLNLPIFIYHFLFLFCIMCVFWGKMRKHESAVAYLCHHFCPLAEQKSNKPAVCWRRLLRSPARSVKEQSRRKP